MDEGLALTRQEIIPYWNAAVYGVCSYVLGIGLLKASAIMLIALVCVFVGYGGRWIMRGGVGILVLTVLAWIGAIPPSDQWHDIAVEMFSRSAAVLAAAH